VPARVTLGPSTNRTPRVTYWTGIWEPTREALSKEIAWLRGELSPRSPIISFTPQTSRVLPGDRVLRINYHRWQWLRGAAVALERLGRVSHVFGGLDASHFLLLLGRRPILFTVAIPARPVEPYLYERVTRFVAESRSLAASLKTAGVPEDRIDVIYPSVDLSHYSPQPPPSHAPFRILFASTPSDPADIDPRGLGLLIDLARARPDIEIVALWRQWGNVAEARRIIESRVPPSNFVVDQRDAVDMASVYRGVHATVCCFEAGHGKSAPNSIVEGLAAGRPALLSDTCGIADLVGERGAGAIGPRSVDGLARAVDELRTRYDDACLDARRLALDEFDSIRCLARYAQLYRTVAERS
jgi:glycosyltransferase involved in cell wall biosynthesis